MSTTKMKRTVTTAKTTTTRRRWLGFCTYIPTTLDEAWEALKGKAEVVWPLRDKEHGMREFGIKDCNGYTPIYGQGA
jgi:hypothetical protein